MLDKYIEPFFAAWCEPDAEARAAALRDAIGDTFTYSDPMFPRSMSDVGELIDYVSMFLDRSPGSTVRVVNLNQTGRAFLATVAFAPPEGAEQQGQYFIEIDDECRLRRLVGFVDQGDSA